MLLEDEKAYVEGVRRAPKDSLGLIGKNEYNLLAGTDAYVFIPGPALQAYSRILTPAELADSTRYNSLWYDAAEKAKLRGARFTFGYVGKDMARMLGKSVDQVVKGQLLAALADFGEIRRKANAVGSRLSDESVAWTEELSVFLLILTTMAGTAAAALRDSHIRIHALPMVDVPDGNGLSPFRRTLLVGPTGNHSSRRQHRQSCQLRLHERHILSR
jgi:hypothetical protein